jgi:hypothetical protein
MKFDCKSCPGYEGGHLWFPEGHFDLCHACAGGPMVVPPSRYIWMATRRESMKLVTSPVTVSLLIAMLAYPGPEGSTAQVNYVPPFTKENISPVRVAIVDNATNGCWTNLNETKDYADAQLELAGIKVTNEFTARSYLVLKVSSKRAQNGLCFGDISLDLFGWVNWGEGRAYVSLMDFGNSFTNANNANLDTLDQVKEFTSQILATLPDGK